MPGMGAPAPAPLATLPAGGLETAIAGTAGAAQTQTAILLPTATFTPSPTRTASVTPTPTVTFIYNFFHQYSASKRDTLRRRIHQRDERWRRIAGR